MKKIGRIISIAALVLAVTAIAVVASACGGVTLPEGNYTGTFTYTSEGTLYGYTASFSVDENNVIWDTTFTAPENATAPGYGMLPWDQSKFTEQFSEVWTVSDLMLIECALDESGVPTGDIDYSSTGMELTVNASYKVGCAAAILAMQNAVQNGLDSANA